ncbi:MAG: FAD/NAD(P)-binding protein [Phycisphaeraceae bacterium]|nr:FAD/NAD(P)-binding protein [Phycisphaeraceae bacterium]
MRTIAIIGGGFSGLAAALHVSRRANGICRMVLIDDAERVGLGVAYRTTRPEHLLNVRAARMSALHHEPDHFVQWLRARKYPFGGDDFVPRAVFGAYLTELYEELRAAGHVDHVRSRCIALPQRERGRAITLANGEVFVADAAVLALGNGPPTEILVTKNGGPATDGRVVQDPWRGMGRMHISPDARIALIGAGLTAVDMVLTLDAIGHRAPITILSRRGMIACGHGAPGRAAVVPLDPSRVIGLSPRMATRWIRRACQAEVEAGGDWRTVIDSLRPVTQSVWAAWTIAERGVFLCHLRTLWDVHRHRMAPSIAERIGHHLKVGRLRVLRARVHSIELLERGLCVRTTRHDPESCEDSSLSFDLVINCTGPGTNPGRWGDPLINGLLDRAEARVDALGLGLETDQHGRLHGEDHSVSRGLFSLGPLRRPSLWETTAVPEIREQAWFLADAILKA